MDKWTVSFHATFVCSILSNNNRENSREMIHSVSLKKKVSGIFDLIGRVCCQSGFVVSALLKSGSGTCFLTSDQRWVGRRFLFGM